jgi:hypothetical protein
MCFPRLQKQGTLASSFGIEPAGAITKHIQPVPITRYQSVLLHSQCWPEQNGLKLHSSLGLKNADPYPYRKTLLGNGISSKFIRFFHQSIWINYNIQPECRPFGGSCPLQVQTLLSSAFAQWGRDGIYPGDPKSNQISYMIRWNPDSYKISPLATLYIPNTSPFRIILPQPSSPAQPLLELPGAQTLAETHGHIYSWNMLKPATKNHNIPVNTYN